MKFKLHDKVKLPKEILKDISGVITLISIEDTGIQYKVRYFWEGKPQEIYFYEWELEKYD